jgi:hypothetical protein
MPEEAITVIFWAINLLAFAVYIFGILRAEKKKGIFVEVAFCILPLAGISAFVIAAMLEGTLTLSAAAFIGFLFFPQAIILPIFRFAVALHQQSIGHLKRGGAIFIFSATMLGLAWSTFILENFEKGR